MDWGVAAPIGLGLICVAGLFWFFSRLNQTSESEPCDEEILVKLKEALSVPETRYEVILGLCLDLEDSEKAERALEMVKRARPEFAERVQSEMAMLNTLSSQMGATAGGLVGYD